MAEYARYPDEPGVMLIRLSREQALAWIGNPIRKAVMDEARARTHDPETSHEAAASVKHLNARRRAVLVVLSMNGALCDEHMSQKYGRTPGLPIQSPSGLRTRRNELVAMGLVWHYGFTTIRNRRARLWSVTAAGEDALRGYVE